MPIFQRKPGKVLTRSRFWHFALAFGATAGGGHFGGDTGSVITGGAIIVGGLTWEISNRWLPGYHPFGDAIDFWSFVAGSFAAGIVHLLL